LFGLLLAAYNVLSTAQLLYHDRVNCYITNPFCSHIDHGVV